ncbi:MAG: carbohydrate ABC transporter permease [Methylobacteriaceae bacterium]|nr:carbohydrate ABC transporter permease [Methylobacteriaceae bacterium]MBV9634415.1 carbohydrate ABC transporter permease [Methylobacteriaceae bacterium]
MARARALRLSGRIPGTGLALRDVPTWLVGMFFVLLWAAPFVWMVSTSFKPPSQVLTQDIEWVPREWTLANYIKVLTQYPVGRWALNSLIVAAASTAMCVLFGAMAGYALARMRFPGRDLVFLVFIGSMMIPPEVGVVPLFIAMLQLGWASTYQALILPTVANVLSVYIFRQFFLSFPRELEDAAIVDGAGAFGIFFRIALPLARSPLIAATVIVFTLNWNNFLWPLLIIFDEDMKTLPVGIAAFAPVIGTHTQMEGFAVGMAAVTLLCIPSVTLFLLLQRYFIQGITAGGLKG